MIRYYLRTCMLVGSSIIFILAFSGYLIQPNHQYFVSSHNGTPKETVSASVCANTTSLVAQFIGKVKVPEGPNGHWLVHVQSYLLRIYVGWCCWFSSLFGWLPIRNFSQFSFFFLGQGLGYNTMTLGHWYIGF